MGDTKGFLKYKRQPGGYRPVYERVKDYQPVAIARPETQSEQQASRCLDCGTPFCHWGCPIGNYIPEWNDLVYNKQWAKAWELLEATNPLPEITGRICPALCEYACVLGINDDPVTIRENELALVEWAFQNGRVVPHPPKKRLGTKVAVIGSGPAGLAAAAQLNKLGHKVTIFERDAKIGGILRYGIPDFKLEKSTLDRRFKIWEAEGIKFKTGINVGVDHPVRNLLKDFDAVLLAGGSRQPRDLKIPGRELAGIHFAMEYLTQSNKLISGELVMAKNEKSSPPGIRHISEDKLITAKGKKVVVIGGGDTGADCVGTAQRQGARSVTQIEVLAQPPSCRPPNQPWPKYPLLFKTSSSHEEGCDRRWSIQTNKFIGGNGPADKCQVKKLACVLDGKEFEIEADLVILAVGFLHPEHNQLLKDLGVAFDERGNVKTDQNYATSVKRVFAAGDLRRGQSLVVWAIDEGRRAALCLDRYLGVC